MGTCYSHLSPDERIRIERLHCEQGLSVRETARLIGGDKAAVSRELKRGLYPRGQGLPVAGGRLLRRDAGLLDDRHEPERRAGQPDAPRRVLHARRRGASDHPLRPRLPLPVARMDPHPRGAQADPIHEREGLLPGQRGRGGVLRASQAGVLPRARLRRRHHQGVHRTTGRIHDLVPGREDQTHFRHQHRQTKT